MKLVTVLVPQAAPTTVPRASETRASRARGNRPSLMNPACSLTPSSVPIVSNTLRNRKTKIKGIIGPATANSKSILKKVGDIDGGGATTATAGLNRFISFDCWTGSAAAIHSGRCGKSH